MLMKGYGRSRWTRRRVRPPGRGGQGGHPGGGGGSRGSGGGSGDGTPASAGFSPRGWLEFAAFAILVAFGLPMAIFLLIRTVSGITGLLTGQGFGD